MATAGPERVGPDLPEEVAQKASTTVEALDAALSDDFNTRAAIAELFGWSRTVLEWEAQFGALSGTALETLAAPYEWANDVLGLCPPISTGATSGSDLDGAVQVAIAARARAREGGDYVEADRIRDELKAAGIILEDNAGVTRWERSRSPA
ncbi:MAG: hypothetical protein L3J96_06155 [Thermoplasmata archaeon]|nr:hypothetical protein [Thermoplasmata archaeon]